MHHTQKLTGYAMIGAPLLMLIADTLFLFSDYPNNFWPASILFFLSLYAFIGLIHGLYHLSNFTKLALVGTLVAVFGVLVGETIMGLERVIWAMNEAGLQEEIINNTVHHPTVFATSRQIGLTFPIGLIILAISIYKAKVINLPSLLLLVVGILLFPVGRIILGPIANVPGDMIMLFFYGKLGLDFIKNAPQQQVIT